VIVFRQDFIERARDEVYVNSALALAFLLVLPIYVTYHMSLYSNLSPLELLPLLFELTVEKSINQKKLILAINTTLK